MKSTKKVRLVMVTFDLLTIYIISKALDLAVELIGIARL